MIRGTLLAVPPWVAYCVAGVVKPASEMIYGPQNRLCGVRSTHNFDSSFAPKMIRGTLLAVPPWVAYCAAGVVKPASEMI